MRKVLAAAAVLVLTGSVCYGQDVVPDLSAGSNALLFTFNGLSVITAGNFDGGAGFKYFLSKSTALRAGFQLAKAGTEIPANPTAPQTGVDGSQSATTIGVSVALERHMGAGRVSPYFGGGVMFSTTRTEGKNAPVGNPPAAQTTTTNRSTGETINGTTYLGGRSTGVFGHFGVEFFLKKEVSLAGEYRLGYTSTSRKDQEATTGLTATTTRVGSASLLGVASSGLLTLAIYF